MPGPVPEENAGPVMEYHRMCGTTTQGLHVYVFGDGFLASRSIPSIAGRVTDGESEQEYVASVVESKVERWLSQGRKMAAIEEPRYTGPPEGALQCLRITEQPELSYSTCEDLPAPVQTLVDDIVSSLTQPQDGNTDKAVPVV